MTWIESTLPSRLDALPWSKWHVRVVVALGITWILDGLEASLVANLGPTLEHPATLGLTAEGVGIASAVYLVGQVFGALLFGHLTDRFGRKRLFLVTLALYLLATAGSGLSRTHGPFFALRFLAGAGIGGEYSAINSAIDEIIPARLRGRVDLAINGSYWIGVAAGAALTLVLLDPARVPLALGWRLAFALGSVLGLAILLVRRDVPESPRWLLMRGLVAEAERTMAEIERRAGARPSEAHRAVRVRVRGSVGARALARVLFVKYPRRSVLAIALMLSQAFLYNAIFFSYGLVLESFHGVRPARVGVYMIPFAAGNFLGPVLLGPLFDRWGRRVMIPATYAISGVLLVATGLLLRAGALDATTQTVAWCAVFFFASAAASSAYLTVSELFPVELRGMVIAVFYAFATLAGASGPVVFARFAGQHDASRLFAGYALAAALMLVAAVIARAYAVPSEGRALEDLSAS
jgi:MFS family permease